MVYTYMTKDDKLDEMYLQLLTKDYSHIDPFIRARFPRLALSLISTNFRFTRETFDELAKAIEDQILFLGFNEISILGVRDCYCISGILINENISLELKQELIMGYPGSLFQISKAIDGLKNSINKRRVSIFKRIQRIDSNRYFKQGYKIDYKVVFNNENIKNFSADSIIKKYIPEDNWIENFKLFMILQ